MENLKLINFTGELDGIENLPFLTEILIENPMISDYSGIGKMGSKLKKLYFYNTKDDEISKFASKDATGVGNYDLTGLDDFGIMGYLLVYNNNYNSVSFTGKLGVMSSNKSENLISSVEILKNLSSKTKARIKNLFLNNNQIKNFKGLEGFTGVELLRIEFNGCETLDGLQNMTNLIYLVARNNSLGTLETYDTSLEDYGKNQMTDSLSFASNLTNISYLDLQSNSLRWIGYLGNLKKLKTLLLSENSLLADVPTIKKVYNSCSKTSIDPSFSLDLLDEETTTKLDLTNRTLTYSNLDSIKNCKKLSDLRIDNIRLTDNNSSQIEDSNTFNDKINEFLSECNAMEYLSLNSLSSLKTISFVSQMNKLVEIELNNTSVVDLSLLNSCLTLKSLAINNSLIDLTTIQTTINRFSSNGPSQRWLGLSYGLILKNDSLVHQLSNCTDLTRLTLMWHDDGFTTDGKLVDLSNCKKLLTWRSCRFKYEVKFPSSLTNLYEWSYSTYLPNFSNCSNLKKIEQINVDEGNYDFATQERISAMISSMVGCINLESLSLCRVGGLSSLECLDALKNLTSLKSLSLGGFSVWNNTTLVNIDGIEKLSHLTDITITWCSNLNNIDSLTSLTNLTTIKIDNCSKLSSIPDLSNSRNSLNTLHVLSCGISDISNLSGLSLTSINFNNNKISNLKSLDDMTSLVSLNLENNTLYPTFSYKDESGASQVGNNIDILVKLNKNGSLKKLYLAGNNGLTDLSKLKELNWTDTSGI